MVLTDEGKLDLVENFGFHWVLPAGFALLYYWADQPLSIGPKAQTY